MTQLIILLKKISGVPTDKIYGTILSFSGVNLGCKDVILHDYC